MANLAASVSSPETFTPLSWRLKTTWENTTEFDRKKCQEKALRGCLIVCGVVAPKGKEDLFQALCQPIQSESENAVSGELLAQMPLLKASKCKF